MRETLILMLGLPLYHIIGFIIIICLLLLLISAAIISVCLAVTIIQSLLEGKRP